MNARAIGLDRHTTRPLNRATFTGWRLGDGAKMAVAHDLVATSLPTIERQIAVAPYYGATIFILEADAVTGGNVLHVYRIRRGKWLGQMDRESGNKVYPHTADLLFRIPVAAFDPVQPWAWSPGCDVVGHTPGLVELRPINGGAA